MYLILKNCKHFILHHKVLFSVFILSQMITTISVLYVTSVFQVSQIQDREYNDSIRTFSISWEQTPSGEVLLDPLQQLTTVYGDTLRQLVLFCEEPRIKSNVIYPSSLYRFVKVGSYFDSTAFNKGAKEIILNEYFDAEGYGIGDTFHLKGTPYTVVGLASNGDYNEVPFYALPENLSFSLLQMKTVEPPSQSQMEEIAGQLEALFPTASLHLPEEPDFTLLSQYNLEYLVSMLIFFLSIINLSTLFQFVLEKRRGQLAIIRTCGCSKWKAGFIYLAEAGLFSTAQFFLSCLIMHLGVSKVFSLLNGARVYSMQLPDYLILYGLYIILLLLVFTLFVIRFTKQSLSSML